MSWRALPSHPICAIRFPKRTGTWKRSLPSWSARAWRGASRAFGLAGCSRAEQRCAVAYSFTGRVMAGRPAQLGAVMLLLAAGSGTRDADQGVDPLTGKSGQIGIPNLTDACVHGSGSYCRTLADKYVKGSGVPKDVDAAVTYYTRGCFNDPDSCVALGVMRLEGREIPKNESEALALFRNACSRGSWNGCSDLGMMYQKGQGGVADPAFGADLFRKGCEREDPLYARAALYPAAELSVDLAMRARSTFESHDHLV